MDQAFESVSVDMIIQNLCKNVEMSKKIVKTVLPKIKEGRTCVCAPTVPPWPTERPGPVIVGKSVAGVN